MRPTLLPIGAAMVVAGCIQGSPQEQRPAEAALTRYVTKTAPEPSHRLGTRFGREVELLGYDLDPPQPEPGGTVEITWYWRCVRELGEGYALFTHLVDAESGELCLGCNFDEESVARLRQLYPPGRWKAGDYVRDVQRLVLPEKLPFVAAEFRVGLYKGPQRLTVTSGPADSEKRALGPRFVTGYEPPPIKELAIPRASSPPTIDGELDEAAWRDAARTGAFVNAADDEPARPRTTAKLLFDDQNLYVAFECDDDHLYSSYTKRDDPLWQDDAVEVFIDPPGSGRDYLEIQVSPQGLIFDTKVIQNPRREDGWDAQAKVATKQRGTFNDDSDRDQGWTAELALPLSSLSATPVGPESTWRLNLFRLDTRLGGSRAFLAWSPPLANTTHVTGRFGRVSFGAPEAPGARGDAAASTQDAAGAAEGGRGHEDGAP